MKICKQRVQDDFKKASITFDKDGNTILEGESGAKTVFGKAIISTDRKRQFRSYLCGVDSNYKVQTFIIDDVK